MKEKILDLTIKNESGLIHNSLCTVIGTWDDIYSMENDILSSSEKEVFNCFPAQARKHDYLLGRIAAKKALMHITPSLSPQQIEICNGVFNFPYINHNSASQISISHTQNTAIALAHHCAYPFGVDIEHIQSSKIETIKSAITKDEEILVKNTFNNIDEGYVSLWTLKEALSKALRCGMLIELPLLEITKIFNNSWKVQAEFKNFPQFAGNIYKQNDYIVSIVLPNNIETNQYLKTERLLI